MVVGSVYAYDGDGLDRVVLSVTSEDGVLTGDTTLFPGTTNPYENTWPIAWPVPAGIATGTAIRVWARALDYMGFAAVDTAVAIVRDSTRVSR